MISSLAMGLSHISCLQFVALLETYWRTVSSAVLIGSRHCENLDMSTSSMFGTMLVRERKANVARANKEVVVVGRESATK